MEKTEGAAGNPKFFDKDYFSSKNYFEGYENYDRDGFWKSIIETVQKYIPDSKKKSVLEIGSAFGFLLKRLPFKKKVGLDISSYALGKAKENACLKGRLTQGLAETLPFPNEQFDCVVGSDVVEHTPDFKATIKEFARVAKIGGVVIFGLPSKGTLEGKLWKKFLDKDLSHVGVPESSEEIKQALEEAGLELLESHYYFPLPWTKISFPRTNVEIAARKKLVFDK